VALVSVLAAGPLPGPWAHPAAAYAEPLGTARVTFSGEVGLLSCTSAPDRSEVRVSAGSPVELVNALGEPARLTLDGQPGPAVAAGEAVVLKFHQGPVAVRLEPDCAGLLHRSFEAVTVEVAPKPPATSPARTAAPPGPAPGAGATGSAGDPGAPGRQAPGAPARTGSAVSAPARSPARAPDTGDPAAQWSRDITGIDPAPSRGNGLLALVAIFCVTGVLVAAVRTILTQGRR